MITSSVVKITFLVAWIISKVAVITSSVAKPIFFAEITFKFVVIGFYMPFKGINVLMVLACY